MKHREGTSKYFVVTAVLFDDDEEAVACDNGIGDIRAQLEFPPYREFRFNSCSRKIREHFLRLVAEFQFFYLAVVIDKCKIHNQFLMREKEKFYNYMVGLVFENLKPRLNDAKVILDRNGGIKFRQELSKYLKKKICEPGGKSLLKKVKMDPSHSNNLLQLADMVCGAVARSFRIDKEDKGFYRNIIRERELDVSVWPK